MTIDRRKNALIAVSPDRSPHIGPGARRGNDALADPVDLGDARPTETVETGFIRQWRLDDSPALDEPIYRLFDLLVPAVHQFRDLAERHGGPCIRRYEHAYLVCTRYA